MSVMTNATITPIQRAEQNMGTAYQFYLWYSEGSVVNIIIKNTRVADVFSLHQFPGFCFANLFRKYRPNPVITISMLIMINIRSLNFSISLIS